MQRFDLDDTVAAISTPIGEGGIGIVRISGKGALSIADKIFISSDKIKPSDFKSYTVHYGWIRSAQSGVIDEVILTVMRSPRSYTKEDIVEINCHSGIVALRAVLDLVMESGARLAEPGEFTRRAFLNGRIDLAQAEAVADIIRAKTDSALKIGIGQLKGALSDEINKIRRTLLENLSVLEADIDFPEEDIERSELLKLSRSLGGVNNKLKDILSSARIGRIFREGIHVVICGKPNVGKSSLLNALLRQERSIVTPVAGTTRDTIEEIIDIKGIPVRIVDTAGIIEPRDLVEKKAVRRSHQKIDSADLVIIVFDGSKRLGKDDLALIRKLKAKQAIAVVNKIDLRQKIDRDKVAAQFKSVVGISAKKSKFINLLEDSIAGLFYAGKINPKDSVLAANARHIEALKESQKLIAGAIDSLDNSASLELPAQDIKEALSYLDGILGKSYSEDLLEKIFSEFCIGK